MPKFTAPMIASLKPAVERYEIWDELLPAFGIRVSPAGKRTWICAVRRSGAKGPGRISVGTFPTMGLAEARTAARKLMADPDGELERRRQAAGITVGAVVSEFIKRDQRGRGRKAWREVEQILERELAPWRDRPISTIRKRDIIELINATTDRAPVMGRRLFAHVSRLFTWALEVDYLEASPVAGVRAPAAGASRERVLTAPELAAVWRAAEALGWPSGPIVQLLTLSGQRVGEVCGMAWTEVDLAAGLWTIPASRTKAAREHLVPLPPAAMAIIRELPRLTGPLVFPSRAGRPIKNLPKAKLDELSGVSGWRVHDLRRTCATGIARLGFPPHVVGAVLNHAAQGVTAIYNRHSYLLEKQAALEAWAQDIHPNITAI